MVTTAGSAGMFQRCNYHEGITGFRESYGLEKTFKISSPTSRTKPTVMPSRRPGPSCRDVLL